MSEAINFLEEALMFGDWGKIEAAINDGTDINGLDENGCTLLACAVSTNEPDNVRRLLELGADVNAKLDANINVLGYAALLFADNVRKSQEVNNIKPEIISILVDAGVDMSDAMLIAIRTGSVKFLDILIQHGADINGNFASGGTPFAITILGIKGGISPQILEYLAEHGANLNEIFDLGDGVETTALNICITLGRLDLMKILLEHGADPNIKDNRGRAALILAFVMGNIDVEDISCLLNSGADVNTQDDEGLTALMWTVLERDKSANFMISALIRTGGLNTENGIKWMCFAYCLSALKRENQLELVKLLIENGADVKIRNKSGMTALTYAAMNFDDEIFSILKSAGNKNKT